MNEFSYCQSEHELSLRSCVAGVSTGGSTRAWTAGRQVLTKALLDNAARICDVDVNGDGDGDGNGDGDDNVKVDLLLSDGSIISLLSPHIDNNGNNRAVNDTDRHRHHYRISLKRR